MSRNQSGELMASYKTEGSLHPWAWAEKAGISWSRDKGGREVKTSRTWNSKTRTQNRISSREQRICLL